MRCVTRCSIFIANEDICPDNLTAPFLASNHAVLSLVFQYRERAPQKMEDSRMNFRKKNSNCQVTRALLRFSHAA